MDINTKNELLKKIKIENIIWIIYIIIIVLCLYSNTFEKDYILSQNNKSKQKYREITITIFSIGIIIYLYFFFDNYKDVKNLKITDTKKKKDLNKLSLLGSTLILISGIIFLYIAIVDTELDVELAFN